MFGQYDGFAILDLPDSAAAGRLAPSVASTGAFTHLETHELFSSDDVLERMRSSQAVEYSAPGLSRITSSTTCRKQRP